MNQLNALEGRRPDLYHVDHVYLILYEGILHRAAIGIFLENTSMKKL